MRSFASVVLAFSMLALPTGAAGQTTTARPQRRYDAGWLHRADGRRLYLSMGSGY